MVLKLRGYIYKGQEEIISTKGISGVESYPSLNLSGSYLCGS